MSESDKTRGLYGKYHVQRVDGEDKGPYFVLAYRTDPHAWQALAEYADSCRDEYPALAADLHAELSKYPYPGETGPDRVRAAIERDGGTTPTVQGWA